MLFRVQPAGVDSRSRLNRMMAKIIAAEIDAGRRQRAHVSSEVLFLDRQSRERIDPDVRRRCVLPAGHGKSMPCLGCLQILSAPSPESMTTPAAPAKIGSRAQAVHQKSAPLMMSHHPFRQLASLNCRKNDKAGQCGWLAGEKQHRSASRANNTLQKRTRSSSAFAKLKVAGNGGYTMSFAVTASVASVRPRRKTKKSSRQKEETVL